MLIVREFAAAMERLAPTSFAEPWDNVGLLVGDPAAPVRGVHLTIDLTPAVLAEAAMLGASVVVAYHPPIFKPVRNFLAGNAAFDAACAGLAVYSPHTAWDAVPGGVNDALCDLFPLEDVRALVPSVGVATSPRQGMGRVGTLASRSRADIARIVRDQLSLGGVLVAGPTDTTASRVAVCAGAGGGLLDAALRAEAEVFVVGELSHHDALRAERAGMTVIATLHSNAERFSLVRMADMLRAELVDVPITLSTCDRDPLRIVTA